MNPTTSFIKDLFDFYNQNISKYKKIFYRTHNISHFLDIDFSNIPYCKYGQYDICKCYNTDTDTDDILIDFNNERNLLPESINRFIKGLQIIIRIKQNEQNILHIQKYYKFRYFYYRLLKINYKIFQYLPVLHSDFDSGIYILSRRKEYFKYISNNKILRSNLCNPYIHTSYGLQNHIKFLISINPNIFKIIPKIFRKDEIFYRQIVIKCIESDGKLLKYAPNKFKSDICIIATAISNTNIAYKYINTKLKNTKYILSLMMKRNIYYQTQEYINRSNYRTLIQVVSKNKYFTQLIINRKQRLIINMLMTGIHKIINIPYTGDNHVFNKNHISIYKYNQILISSLYDDITTIYLILKKKMSIYMFKYVLKYTYPSIIYKLFTLIN